MAVKPIPEGYHSVTPYLSAPSGEALIGFLERAFGATVTELLRRPDGTFWHGEVRIGDSTVMIGEGRPDWPPRGSALYLYVEDTDATYRRALAAGATSIMEPVDVFYGDRNAGVQDPAGNQWWIATHVEDVPPDEMKRRADAQAAKRTT